MAEPCIELREVEFRYPNSDYCLSIPKLQVEAGQHTVIIGPSGSGKTTLLHLLAGIHQADRGQVRVNELDLQKVSDAQRRHFRLGRIGMVFQEFELLEHLTVRENILLPWLLAAKGRADTTLEDRVRSLTQRTGMERYLRRKPRRLSQGERQRVAICRALVKQPPIVLADEPTGNLDPKTSADILDLLFNEVQSQGATLVLVTHDHSSLDRFEQTVDFAQFLGAAS